MGVGETDGGVSYVVGYVNYCNCSRWRQRVKLVHAPTENMFRQKDGVLFATLVTTHSFKQDACYHTSICASSLTASSAVIF
jgi:flagellar basal body rod protein FlgF